MHIRWAFVLYSFVVGCFATVFYLTEQDVNTDFLKFLIVLNISVFYIIYLKNDPKKRLLHPIVIFTSTLILFIYGRVVLDFLGLADIKIPNLMSDIEIAGNIIRKTLLVLVIYFAGHSIGALLINQQPIFIPNHGFNNYIFRVGRAFFFIGAIPALYIQVLTLQEINSLGYLAIFRGEIQVDVPIIVRFTAGFFRIGFILIAISYPNRGTMLKYIFIFSIFIALNLLSGIRGYYLSFLLVLLWYWFGFRNFGNTSINKIFIFGLLMLVFAQFVVMVRDSYFTLSSLINFSGFLYDQSTSLLALVYGIEYAEMIDTLSYLNLFDVFHRKGNLIQDQIDYAVNPGAKDLGHSLGGSIIQEHILIGGPIGLFLFSIFWAILIGHVYRESVKSRFGVALLIMILPNIFFSPRARTLDFVAQNFIFFIVFSMVFIIFGFYKDGYKKSAKTHAVVNS